MQLTSCSLFFQGNSKPKQENINSSLSKTATLDSVSTPSSLNLPITILIVSTCIQFYFLLFFVATSSSDVLSSAIQSLRFISTTSRTPICRLCSFASCQLPKHCPSSVT